MYLIRGVCALIALILPAASLVAQATDAAAIMARVAENQDRAEAQRARFTYVQHADTASRKGGKVLCREVTESRVTPTADGSSQSLLTLRGTLWLRKQYVSYTEPLSGTLEPGHTRQIELKDDEDQDVDLWSTCAPT